MSGKAGRSGGAREGAGRKRVVGADFRFRALARTLTAEFADQARDTLKAQSETDPGAFFANWLKIAEHGFGRPPQSLDVQVGVGLTVLHAVTLADGRALPAAVAGLPGAGDPEHGEG